MRKLFDNYGIVILICFVVVALIGMIGLLLRGSTSNGGWVGDAYKEIIESYTVNLNLKIRGWTDYTLEEIEADEHLYAIGKTKPEYVVAKFNSDYTEVTVVKNGEDSDGIMADYNAFNNKSPFFKHRNALESAVVYKNVTTIGRDTFYGCTSLSKVTIHKNVTTIGLNAFNGCSSLKSVVIPYKVTFVAGNAFSGCTSLTNITIPNRVTSIEKGAFSGCTSLQSVTISDGVTNINNNAFSYCTSLESVTIPGSVMNINISAFMGCTSLTTVYGMAGSYAETWANDNGYTFVAA